MTTHTPGPWTVQPYNELTDSFHITTADPDFAIAEVLPYHEREAGTTRAEADARLIAAAPEMLSMLRHLGDALDYYHEHEGATETRKQYRALLARMEG